MGLCTSRVSGETLERIVNQTNHFARGREERIYEIINDERKKNRELETQIYNEKKKYRELQIQMDTLQNEKSKLPQQSDSTTNAEIEKILIGIQLILKDILQKNMENAKGITDSINAIDELINV